MVRQRTLSTIPTSCGALNQTFRQQFGTWQQCYRVATNINLKCLSKQQLKTHPLRNVNTSTYRQPTKRHLIKQQSCHLHTSSNNQHRVCVVGSGPAGFYTAQHVLKHVERAQVDIFEKLPVPFGLVRYGVAPDHPEMKNAITTFEEVANDQRCRFYGNVNIGSDVTADKLRSVYDAVVFAYGADDDKKMNISGEDGEGVLAARAFVGWYNGLPAHRELQPNLDCETAVVVGQGNVALDVARMLLAPLQHLQKTDICSHALEALSKSRIRHVKIIGRRSPLEVSFTIKELREMIKLPGVTPVFNKEDFLHIPPIIKDLPRPRKRLIDLMCNTCLEPTNTTRNEKQWSLEFLENPSEVLLDEQRNVMALKVERNKLIDDEDGNKKPVGLNEFENIDCGLLLRSIGYKSIHVDKGIPFDQRLGVIPNIEGRVVEQPRSTSVVKGLYCSGWVKHGPVGIIATTMNEAYSTAQNIVQDIQSGFLSQKEKVDVELMMKNKRIDFVSFEDFEKIDTEELWRGKEKNKPREKITSSKEMLDLAFNKNKDS